MNHQGLNRTVAVAKNKGVDAGLAILQDIELRKALNDASLWNAVLADLCRRKSDSERAR